MIFIKDNSFENPEKFRIDAIKKYKNKEFQVSENYPGKRCFVNDKSLLNLFSYKVGKILNENVKCQQLSYDFIDKNYCMGLPHDDRGRKYTSILYLNMNPPEKSGTDLFSVYLEYLNKQLYLNEDVNAKLKRTFFGKNNRNFLERYLYKKTVKDLLKDLKYKISVENKYNRLLIFDSNLVHRAQNYFGCDINSRLCLVGFFK
jgi:hypothetical protein